MATRSSSRADESESAALVHEWCGRIAQIGWLGLPEGSVGDDARMKSRVHPKFKTKYRINNWAEYDLSTALG
jgi:hypothetical protein